MERFAELICGSAFLFTRYCLGVIPFHFLNVLISSIDKLKNLDVSVLTPIESMNILFDLVKLVNN